MKPILHFGPLEPQTCNPHNIVCAKSIATAARSKLGNLKSLIGIRSGSGLNGEGLTDSDAILSCCDVRYSKPPIRSLELYGNKGITAIGLEELAKAIASPGCKLESLDVRLCSLGEEGIQEFSAHLPSMAHLSTLDVRFNKPFSDSTKSQLQSAWAKAGKSANDLSV